MSIIGMTDHTWYKTFNLWGHPTEEIVIYHTLCRSNVYEIVTEMPVDTTLFDFIKTCEKHWHECSYIKESKDDQGEDKQSNKDSQQ